MKQLPWLFISSGFCEGSHNGYWSAPLPTQGDGQLAPVATILAALDEAVYQNAKLGLLLSEDLMYPLRVALTEKAPRAELNQFLQWKLKRFLPFPVQQAVTRFLPLLDAKHYMTLNLRQPWLEALVKALGEKGVQLGYVGGLFVTLTENTKHFRGGLNICVYDDFYLLVTINNAGAYTSFRTRRLPFDNDNLPDLDILCESDLAAAIQTLEAGAAVRLYNFAPNLDDSVNELHARLQQQHGQVRLEPAAGPAVKRFLNLLGGGGRA